MSTHPEFTFFSRFVADIQAGRKTITIRDESEANWQPGQRLALFTNPEHRPFWHHRGTLGQGGRLR